jgi:ribonuclease E
VLRFFNRFQPQLVRASSSTPKTRRCSSSSASGRDGPALKSKVWLKSGGHIVINQTEALVAIDINTGKYVGKTRGWKTPS